MNRQALIVILSLSILIIISCNTDPSPKKGNDNTVKTTIPFTKHGTLAFLTNNCSDTIKVIDIETAITDPERARGLMFRYSMDDSQGMLFVMDQNRIQHFYMRNTYISLDILYVNPNKEIVSIAKYTEVLNDRSIPSNAPAIFVVEVNAGFCDTWNIKPGDCIDFTVDQRRT